ncbi:MAG TPA: hypothetical protein QF720_07060 [Nitrospinota bacterium]|nr:hypothetical protein [Nitrospinota bacterium]|tara:strand:+ start:113927 stop:114568 length:642 start_codon:yes stop_codon:yes gene_type:complete
MGDLKNQIFLEQINVALDEVRDEYTSKHTVKKQNRFLIKDITYEISRCDVDSETFTYNISSKIPNELVPKNYKAKNYYNFIAKLLNKSPIKPAINKMESVVQNSRDMEYKEREYAKFTYRFKEHELYNNEELKKCLEGYHSKKFPLPSLPGISTLSGRMVLVLVRKNITEYAKRNISDLINANEKMKIELSKKRIAKKSSIKKSSTKKPSAKK